MAHSQQQYPPRTFSPLQSASSPQHGAFLPPSKRQRLSPNPQSPYNSPSMTNIALPNQVFSSPYYGAQPNGGPNGAPSDNSYNSLNPPPPAGIMGPPSRPVDKPTDMNELSDVLLGSGVDLKEEEAALLTRHNHSYQQQLDPAYTSNYGNSYNPYGHQGPMNGPTVASHEYGNVLSQNVPGDRNSFYGAGTFNQAPVPHQSVEERAELERTRATRRKMERRQHHLNEPFLYVGSVHQRIYKQAQSRQVIVPKTGVLSSTNQAGKAVQVAVAGPDKNERLVALKGQDLLYQDAPIVEILSLISLAAEERLRALVEDAASLAKGRRTGAHGVVPAELADLAVGDGNFEAVALPTPSNSAVSPKSNPLKRSYASINKPPTPISNGNHSPTTTIAFPNILAQALRQSALAERAAEQERIAKRARRVAADLMASEGSRSGSTAPGASGSSTPALMGEQAPEVSKKGPNRKEQKRQAEAKATEAQQHAATNKTTMSVLGLGNVLGGKKLSWMSGGAANSSSSMLPRVNTNMSKTATTNGDGSSLPIGKKYGEFREDKENGARIQLRDMVSVLETDGKEKRALARAYTRLDR